MCSSDLEKAPQEAKEMQRDFFPEQIGYDSSEMYVVLPLTSKTGSILGFTKRRVDGLHRKYGFIKINDNGKEKFTNSKWKHSTLQNSLIGQCHNVYNLYNASPEIRKTGIVVVNEGPKDVIAWRRASVEHAVGVCGTSNSNNIWDSILPAKTIYLSMDGDDVGVGTVVKNIIYLASKHNISEIFALKFPAGKDPYDIMTEFGIDELKNIYNHPISALDFVCTYGNDDDVLAVYDAVPEFSKIKVMASICKCKGYNISEAESWLTSISKKRSQELRLDRKSVV